MGVDEHTIELGSSPVFYRSAPARGLTPLYLHGVPTSSDDWVAFIERTGGVAPDLIGFGRSGKAGNLDYTLEGLVSFVEQFVAELELERVQLVAHDWGGAVALVFAGRHPERVERLAICNAVPLLNGFHWHRWARLWRRPLIGELAMGATTRWVLARGLREGSAHREAWSDAAIAAVYEQFDQGTQRAILRLYRSADEPLLAAEGARLPAFDAPALVVWGASDPWLPIELGERCAESLPQAVLERVADAGHWPWLDQPDVVERIATFLEE